MAKMAVRLKRSLTVIVCLWVGVMLVLDFNFGNSIWEAEMKHLSEDFDRAQHLFVHSHIGDRQDFRPGHMHENHVRVKRETDDDNSVATTFAIRETPVGRKRVVRFDPRLLLKELNTSEPYGENMHHHVWFETKHTNDDRIISQMSLAAPLVPRPTNVGDKRGAKTPKPALKTILLFNGLPKFVKPGQVQFLSEDCPVKTCYLTGDKKDSSKADAVVLGGRHPHTPSVKPQGQVWVMWGIESPKYWQMPVTLGDRINWTATYRHDSTIVTPYEKYVPHKYSTLKQGTLKNYASGKQKKVAWFASRCKSNNKREDYVKELAKYIEVDIYGPCGSKTCPKFSAECYNMLSNDYKFYLSFENSNCRDYITEKFFVNGLGNDVIPIAMGAHPDDYKRAAPPHSYIHVEDFRSAKELAEYLHKLDKNDDLYNEYFRWKGSMKKINTHFFCRLCAMVHEAENHRTWYKDIREWWGGEGVCRTEQRWTDGEPHF